jgi:hypothetical protein
MKYIGLDDHEYATIAELTEANRKVKEHPLYLKEMRRRSVANIPGSITREEWKKLWTSTYLEPFKKVPDEVQEKPEKIGSGILHIKEMEKKSANADVKEVVSVKKKYASNMSDERRRLLKRANAKKMEFDLTEEQVSSLLEKKCYFCRVKSETLITVGSKFDYPSSRAVCGTCKRVHDLLGDEMQEYIDRLIQD